MEKHILSKSTYIKGEQCLKQLYLHKKRAFLRDRMPAERLAIFRRGTHVGIYAQELFPGGIDAGPKHPSQYKKAVEKTALLIQEGRQIIYEAGFQAHKTLILLDILVKNGEAWDAYEVKSSKKLSETYYKDAALQYYILKEAGLKINSFSLIHINDQYIREDNIDINKLFVITNVSEEVEKRYNEVEKKIDSELKILEATHSPKIAIGLHCFKPYTCDFIGHCWKGIEKPSIFDIPAFSLETQFDYYKQQSSLNELLEDSSLSTAQRNQIEVQLSGKERINLSTESKAILKNIIANPKNYIYLKIISFTPALPLYPNTKAYQSLRFALSWLPLGEPKEKTELYFSSATNNPDLKIEQMLVTLLKDKKAIVYSANQPITNSIDMQQTLKDSSYYHPLMKDYSNKSLSKALGIKPPWKGIESDIVAAQYYDEIVREHKDSKSKKEAIESYLSRELSLLSLYINKLTSTLE